MHRDEARFANEAFYLAFARRDLDAMEALRLAVEQAGFPYK